MRKLHSTIYLGISIFISLLMILMVVFFFRIIQNKNHHTVAVMTTLEKKISEKNNIDTLVKEVDYINSTNKLIEQHFVDSTRIDDMVGYLEKLGESQGATLSVKGVKASEKKDDNKIEVEILVDGEFSDILKIVGFLENSIYQISIDSIYINKNIKPDFEKIPENEKVVFTPWQANISFNIISLK